MFIVTWNNSLQLGLILRALGLSNILLGIAIEDNSFGCLKKSQPSPALVYIVSQWIFKWF